MSSEFSESVLLLNTAEEELLFTELVRQLIKDFALANVDVAINCELITAKQLKVILHEKIYYLILEQFASYLNLLYIIDVPEKALRSLKITDVVGVAEQVTFLVLQREFQKVRLKKKYS